MGACAAFKSPLSRISLCFELVSFGSERRHAEPVADGRFALR